MRRFVSSLGEKDESPIIITGLARSPAGLMKLASSLRNILASHDAPIDMPGYPGNIFDSQFAALGIAKNQSVGADRRWAGFVATCKARQNQSNKLGSVKAHNGIILRARPSNAYGELPDVGRVSGHIHSPRFMVASNARTWSLRSFLEASPPTFSLISK